MRAAGDHATLAALFSATLGCNCLRHNIPAPTAIFSTALRASAIVAANLHADKFAFMKHFFDTDIF
jgi:hypothetical protein